MMPLLPTSPGTLISALASKPQLVTLALDCLIAHGDLPGEVLILHTDARYHPTQSGLATLRAALPRDYPHLSSRYIELRNHDAPLRDVTAPDEVQAAFRTLYGEMRRLKQTSARVHLLISGGRRTLTVFGMAAAQMLFDDEDRLWHLPRTRRWRLPARCMPARANGRASFPFRSSRGGDFRRSSMLCAILTILFRP
ncbi:MAG: CRISPR-associated ring nuclease [Anaerolineales bacterium]